MVDVLGMVVTVLGPVSLLGLVLFVFMAQS